ncbi:GrpB family protein [Hymenobacter latericus]|uniref:GrpB family protein n=1 Tax=Hymenobacter sp. YIM 151858-1 TaxID=2987688 RepID=UPI002227B2F5|nr:GrpB family protein [Hymenobacter sp. YIM 151858-1]UYZ61244.1 GrpB family protein [Hymenobacter sp. YIM 151858-1]
MLLQAYQERWPADFQAIAQVLRAALPGLPCVAEHVGSTAVPGLAAKPIIDLDLLYSPPVTLPQVAAGLAAIGYAHVGDQGIPGRDVFKRVPLGLPHPVLDRVKHHLYVCADDSREWHRHRVFRDYLRRHADARQQYEALKMRLAAEAGQDQRRYAELKQTRAQGFVARVLRQASGVASDLPRA